MLIAARSVVAGIVFAVGAACVERPEQTGPGTPNESPRARPTTRPTSSAPSTKTPDATAGPERTARATASPSPEATPQRRRPLRRGDAGGAVRALQQRLHRLGYWVGTIDGTFGVLTQQGVYAFQAYEEIPVTGTADAGTLRRLDAADRPAARSTSGDLIEVDKKRQLLFVVDGGGARWVFNTSTGTDERYRHPDGHIAVADTPSGKWTIEWQVDGWREGDLGPLWRPKYFHRDGLAIHGYGNVPPERASHGCVRVRFAAMDFIWREGFAPVGSTVWVY